MKSYFALFAHRALGTLNNTLKSHRKYGLDEDNVIVESYLPENKLNQTFPF